MQLGMGWAWKNDDWYNRVGFLPNSQTSNTSHQWELCGDILSWYVWYIFWSGVNFILWRQSCGLHGCEWRLVNNWRSSLCSYCDIRANAGYCFIDIRLLAATPLSVVPLSAFKLWKTYNNYFFVQKHDGLTSDSLTSLASVTLIWCLLCTLSPIFAYVMMTFYVNKSALLKFKHYLHILYIIIYYIL